jgi:hypothetical protein
MAIALTTPRLPFDKPLDILEKSKPVAHLALALVVAGPLMLAAAVAGVFPLGFMGIHVLGLGLLMTYASAWRNLRPKRRRAPVRVDREGVAVGGALGVPRARVANGYFQPRPHRGPSRASSVGSSVRLLDKHRRIVFEAEADEREALELLSALGLDPASKRVEFSGSSPLFATFARNMLFVVLSMVAMFACGVAVEALGLRSTGPIFPMLMLPWFLVSMLPSRISVGIDGVHERWLWRKRLIPMAQIAGVERIDDRQLWLRLRDGSGHMLFTSMHRKNNLGTSFAKQHGDAVQARIAEAHQAFLAHASAADVSALVAKGTRTREEWLAALGKLRDAQGGYRDAVVRDDDLWRLVEDPSAPADARGGAALLLRRSLDEEGKARVRVAAEATASPQLRVALDAAAGAADETFESALHELAELADEPAPARGGRRRA